MSGQFGGISSLQTPPGHPEFVNLSQDYKCRICQGVLRDSMQTTCGHRVCEGCIPLMFDGKQEPIKCPVNDEGCDQQRRDTMIPDPDVRREVRNLIVYCTKKDYGCEWKRPWKYLEQHEPTCDYRLVDCSFKEYGCSSLVPLKHKQKHETSECEFRTKHELRGHLDNCPNKPFECEFKQAGCDFRGTLEDVTEHMTHEKSKHQKLFIEYMTKSEQNTVEIERQLQEKRTEREHDRQLNQADMAEISSLKSQVEALANLNKELEADINSKTEHIRDLERDFDFEDVATKSDGNQLKEHVNQLQTSLIQVQSQVAQLESEETTRRPDGHATRFAQVNMQMDELRMKFESVEPPMLNGELLWTLRDYNRRKTEAVTENGLSLTSQPFYSHTYGYKMCAKVYLNGKGNGKGTNISLYFVIMKGEHDSLLTWPFQQKVTMSLMNQDSSQKNMSVTFQPNPNSSSYQKPTSDMNLAYGFPRFVSHNVLETPRYIKGDIIFLRVVVDTSNLTHP